MPVSVARVRGALRRAAADPTLLPMTTWAALFATFTLGWIAVRYLGAALQWHGYFAAFWTPDRAAMFRGMHASTWCYTAPVLAWLVPWLIHRRQCSTRRCFEVVRGHAEHARYRLAGSLESRLLVRAAHRARRAFMQRLALFGLLLVVGLPWLSPPRLFPARCFGWGWEASLTDIHLLSALWLLAFIGHIPTSRRILGAPPVVRKARPIVGHRLRRDGFAAKVVLPLQWSHARIGHDQRE